MGKPFFPQLPLDGHDLRPDRAVEKQPVEGEAAVEGEIIDSDAIPAGPQYRRLFGTLTPAQVMVSVAPFHSSGGNGTDGSPSALCDPTQAASHPSSSISAAVASMMQALLAEHGHPSALSLASIVALRLRHIAKGRTPATDAEKGSAYFWRCADQAWHDAIRARCKAKRRELLIIAASILIAQIDAEDFQSAKEPTP